MAAVIQLHEMSALDAGADKTSGTVRFKDADNATVDLNNPLVIPAAGTIYSYTKKLRAYMQTAPAVQVDNFRWYSDGTNNFGTGIGVTVKNLGTTWGANYKTQMGGGADFFSYNSGSALQGDVTDTGPFTSTEEGDYIGDLIELQMSVANSATSGSKGPEAVTLALDEI